MSQIHFIGGEKGGVGKSLLSRVIAQHLVDRDLPFVGLDTDRSHGALLRYYGDYSRPMPAEGPESFDRIVDAAAEDPQRRVLVDLAAQTQGLLLRWIDEGGVTDVAADLGVALRYWHVMDNGRDSTHLLERWLDGPGARLPLVIVLNEVRGDDFAQLDETGLLPRAEQQGARVMRLPKLADTPLQKMDASGLSFWAAQQPGAMGLMDRQRLRVWLQRLSAELDTLAV